MFYIFYVVYDFFKTGDEFNYYNFSLLLRNDAKMEFITLISIIFTSLLSGYSSIQCIFNYLIHPYFLGVNTVDAMRDFLSIKTNKFILMYIPQDKSVQLKNFKSSKNTYLRKFSVSSTKNTNTLKSIKTYNTNRSKSTSLINKIDNDIYKLKNEILKIVKNKKTSSIDINKKNKIKFENEANHNESFISSFSSLQNQSILKDDHENVLNEKTNKSEYSDLNLCLLNVQFANKKQKSNRKRNLSFSNFSTIDKLINKIYRYALFKKKTHITLQDIIYFLKEISKSLEQLRIKSIELYFKSIEKLKELFFFFINWLSYYLIGKILGFHSVYKVLMTCKNFFLSNYSEINIMLKDELLSIIDNILSLSFYILKFEHDSLIYTFLEQYFSLIIVGTILLVNMRSFLNTIHFLYMRAFTKHESRYSLESCYMSYCVGMLYITSMVLIIFSLPKTYR